MLSYMAPDDRHRPLSLPATLSGFWEEFGFLFGLPWCALSVTSYILRLISMISPPLFDGVQMDGCLPLAELRG